MSHDLLLTASYLERPEELTIRDPRVLATLYDPTRYRVFRALKEPQSVPQLAIQLGVSANRLYYHVRRLIEAGLIVQLNTRVAGNHTERVYGHAAARMRIGGDVRMAEAASGIAAVLDEAFEEVRAAVQSHHVAEVEQDGGGVFAWHTAQLTEDSAREFERRFEALVAEFADAEKKSAGSTSTTRYAMLGVLTRLPSRESPR